MSALTKKIDFIGFITVERSNPNGDPLNGNQPRTDYGGYGEISDVCLKRKLRNRLQDAGEKILVQSNERADDGCDSIRSRVEANPAMEKPLKMKDKEEGAHAYLCRRGVQGMDGCAGIWAGVCTQRGKKTRC